MANSHGKGTYKYDTTNWKVCPECQKRFDLLYQHTWTYKKHYYHRTDYYCSYKCYRKKTLLLEQLQKTVAQVMGWRNDTETVPNLSVITAWYAMHEGVEPTLVCHEFYGQSCGIGKVHTLIRRQKDYVIKFAERMGIDIEQDRILYPERISECAV